MYFKMSVYNGGRGEGAGTCRLVVQKFKKIFILINRANVELLAVTAPSGVEGTLQWFLSFLFSRVLYPKV